MRIKYLNELYNLWRKIEHSEIHRIFFGYTVFNGIHFFVMTSIFFIFSENIRYIDFTSHFEMIYKLVVPVTVLLGFVVGFMQFIKTHLRFRYIHARNLTANMFLGLAWIYFVQIVVMSLVYSVIANCVVCNVNLSGDGKFTISNIVTILSCVAIFVAVIFIAWDKMLKPTIHKGFTFVILNIASVQIYLASVYLFYLITGWLSAQFVFNINMIVLFFSAVAYCIFSILCICMGLLAASSRIGGGFLDLDDKEDIYGKPSEYSATKKSFDRMLLQNIEKQIAVNATRASDRFTFASEITIFQGDTFAVRDFLWESLMHVRCGIENVEDNSNHVFTIYFSIDMPAHILLHELKQRKMQPKPERLIVIDCFNDYAGFGELPISNIGDVKVFRSDSESMLNMHMCLRKAFTYIEKKYASRKEWYINIVIDSLTSLLNITPGEDLLKFFYHVNWCRKFDATRWCLSNVITLVDKEKIKSDKDSYSTYYKIRNVVRNVISHDGNGFSFGDDMTNKS